MFDIVVPFLNPFLNLFNTGVIFEAKALKNISLILSKKPLYFCVFWFGRGPPPYYLLRATFLVLFCSFLKLWLAIKGQGQGQGQICPILAKTKAAFAPP